jgi:hypothetical protein
MRSMVIRKEVNLLTITCLLHLVDHSEGEKGEKNVETEAD